MPSSRTDRFIAKIEQTDGCWFWIAAKNAHGYGIFVGGNGRTVLAHRLAYELFIGPIPDDLQVNHSCDTPACVNPDHLWLGTQLDNIRDRDAKGRTKKGGTFQKLSPEIHDEIRRRYAVGDISQGALAEAYGVSQTSISSIVQQTEGYQPLSLSDRGKRRAQFQETRKTQEALW